MKVVPDSSGVSALDTWLRDAGTPATVANQAALAEPSAASDVTQQPRDTAEDLLALDIWSGSPPGQLRAVDLPRAPQDHATVQHWAEHIFSPLR